MDNEYENLIKKYVEGRLNTNIPNSTMDRAFIGLKYLIRSAENHIRVVSDEFYDPFWSRLEYSLDNFSSKANSSLEVVVLKRCVVDRILSKLSKSHPGKISLFKFSKPDLARKINNYVTVDSCGYRFEASDEKKKSKLVTGIINYGDKSGTEKLNGIFETIKLKSELVRLGDESPEESPVFLGNRKFFSSFKTKSFY